MYYIGIDLGGTNIAAGVVNESCEIIAKGSVPTGRLRPFADIMKDMADLCKKLIADAGISESEVKSIGIASPGTPDVENVKVVYANNLPAFIDAPVGDELKKYFPNVEVYIENDANAAAFGEIIAGAAAGEKDVVVITLGTGVGGGIVIGGKIYAGFNHNPAGNTDWMNDFALSVNSETPSIAGYILLVIWIVGIFAMIILVIKSSLRLRTLEKSALSLQNPEVRRLYHQCLEEMRIHRNIPVYSTAFLKSPIIVGLLKPCIYLPIHLISDYNESDMRYMLLHELQHYKHKDAVASYLMNLRCV